ALGHQPLDVFLVGVQDLLVAGILRQRIRAVVAAVPDADAGEKVGDLLRVFDLAAFFGERQRCHTRASSRPRRVLLFWCVNLAERGRGGVLESSPVMDAPSPDPLHVLAAAARLFYERGWMMGTAGNLSLRLADGTFWITASGKPKGRLQAEDFLRVAPGGEVLKRGREEDRPSAETSLHDAVYRLFPEAGA